MHRRDVLKSTLAAGLGLTPVGAALARAADPPRTARVLMFTKSAAFEHSVVRRDGNELAHAERVLTDVGKKHGFDVLATKDGRVFDDDLAQFDAFFFYTTGDLTERGKDGQPPMSAEGKKRLLAAVADGKGFIGSHCASDTFHTAGDRFEEQATRDPYIDMIGGEFIKHGKQQESRMVVADAAFPGLAEVGGSFPMTEEWYSLKNFANDLRVILVQDTQGMVGPEYDRPPYPATWARMHGRGRVYFTSMGHREDVWTNPTFQRILLGGMDWAVGRVSADLTPNMAQVAPGARVMPPLGAAPS